jgi:hypothetical protein
MVSVNCRCTNLTTTWIFILKQLYFTEIISKISRSYKIIHNVPKIITKTYRTLKNGTQNFKQRSNHRLPVKFEYNLLTSTSHWFLQTLTTQIVAKFPKQTKSNFTLKKQVISGVKFKKLCLYWLNFIVFETVS